MKTQKTVRLSTLIKSCGKPSVVVDKENLPADFKKVITVESCEMGGADFGIVGFENVNVLHYLVFSNPIPDVHLEKIVIGINNF